MIRNCLDFLKFVPTRDMTQAELYYWGFDMKRCNTCRYGWNGDQDESKMITCDLTGEIVIPSASCAEWKETNEHTVHDNGNNDADSTDHSNRHVYKGQDQKVKADEGKPKLTLVPLQIIYDIASVREYGNAKYPEGGIDNWKQVEPQRYKDAAFRHFLAYIQDPTGVDEESGLPHRWHLECNLAFLAELEKEVKDDKQKKHSNRRS